MVRKRDVDAGWAVRLYNEGYSIRQIARQCRPPAAYATVRLRLVLAGVKLRPVGQNNRVAGVES